ncbi:MAG: putative metal-binding motif-containing protein [Polyangiales bacterium]
MLLPRGGSSPGPDDSGSRRDGGICAEDRDCEDDVYCNGVERCDPGARDADEAGCVSGPLPCEAPRVCLESTATCSDECPDLDRDGHADARCGGDDCDDDDPDRYAGNVEVCDSRGHDEDCDPTTFGRRDVDGDGAIDAACCNDDGAGTQRCGTDCDDTRGSVAPGNVEACNLLDDDCDGRVDEGAQVALYVDADRDGDGDASAEPMPGCAGTVGTSTTNGDCNDAAPGINVGAPEVCNAIDDDCDGRVDDIRDDVVVCASESSRPCTTAAGLTGTQACRADCLAYLSCVADEVCNGIDDDLDGLIDDGFACARGEILPCTNSCGSEGTTTCTTACMPGVCRAAEVCNFCDDDGVEGIAGERADATTLAPRGLRDPGARLFGAATRDAESRDEGFIDFARLLDGTAVTQTGAYWLDLDRFQGWGPTTLLVEMRVRTTDGEQAMGGWSVILADRTSGVVNAVGTAQDRGVPNAGSGARFDWIWGYPASMGPDLADRLAYARLPSTWRGQIFSGVDPIYGRRAAGTHLDRQTSFVTQTVVVVYQPEDPYTVTREERVTIGFPLGGETACTAPGGACASGRVCVAPRGGSSGLCMLGDSYFPGMGGGAVEPANDVPLATRLAIGITAGTYRYTFRPPGSPVDVSVGGPVVADVLLYEFQPPPAGSGLMETHLDRSAIARGGLCSGPY